MSMHLMTALLLLAVTPHEGEVHEAITRVSLARQDEAFRATALALDWESLRKTQRSMPTWSQKVAQEVVKSYAHAISDYPPDLTEYLVIGAIIEDGLPLDAPLASPAWGIEPGGNRYQDRFFYVGKIPQMESPIDAKPFLSLAKELLRSEPSGWISPATLRKAANLLSIASYLDKLDKFWSLKDAALPNLRWVTQARVTQHFCSHLNRTGLWGVFESASDWAWHGSNQLSLHEGIRALEDSVLLPDARKRYQALEYGLVCVGAGAHLIQDQSSPAHTRDDAHPPIAADLAWIEDYVGPEISALVAPYLDQKSFLEQSGPHVLTDSQTGALFSVFGFAPPAPVLRNHGALLHELCDRTGARFFSDQSGPTWAPEDTVPPRPGSAASVEWDVRVVIEPASARHAPGGMTGDLCSLLESGQARAEYLRGVGADYNGASPRLLLRVVDKGGADVLWEGLENPACLGQRHDLVREQLQVLLPEAAAYTGAFLQSFFQPMIALDFPDAHTARIRNIGEFELRSAPNLEPSVVMAYDGPGGRRMELLRVRPGPASLAPGGEWLAHGLFEDTDSLSAENQVAIASGALRVFAVLVNYGEVSAPNAPNEQPGFERRFVATSAIRRACNVQALTSPRAQPVSLGDVDGDGKDELAILGVQFETDEALLAAAGMQGDSIPWALRRLTTAEKDRALDWVQPLSVAVWSSSRCEPLWRVDVDELGETLGRHDASRSWDGPGSLCPMPDLDRDGIVELGARLGMSEGLNGVLVVMSGRSGDLLGHLDVAGGRFDSRSPAVADLVVNRSMTMDVVRFYPPGTKVGPWASAPAQFDSIAVWPLKSALPDRDGDGHLELWRGSGPGIVSFSGADDTLLGIDLPAAQSSAAPGPFRPSAALFERLLPVFPSDPLALAKKPHPPGEVSSYFAWDYDWSGDPAGAAKFAVGQLNHLVAKLRAVEPLPPETDADPPDGFESQVGWGDESAPTAASDDPTQPQVTALEVAYFAEIPFPAEWSWVADFDGNGSLDLLLYRVVSATKSRETESSVEAAASLEYAVFGSSSAVHGKLALAPPPEQPSRYGTPAPPLFELGDTNGDGKTELGYLATRTDGLTGSRIVPVSLP